MKKKTYGSVCLLICLASMTMGMLGGCGRDSQAGGRRPEAEQTADADRTEQESVSAQEDGASQDGAQAETAGQKEAAGTDGQSSGITFEAQDLEGNTVTEAVFTESKLTMVNVWATYCNPCLSEMPGLGELAGEYETDEFQIIGIISDVQEGAETDATEYASALVTQTGAAYTHLLLNESLFRSMLSGVSAVPTTFFVDGKGEVLDTVVGAMDKESWKEKIDGLLEE